jgi:hypothetical protein
MTGLKVFAAILITAFCCFSKTAHAQPQLPDMVGATHRGMNILGWTAQYDGIKSIAVQRSSDSIYNFTTIGFVKNLKKGPQGFIDGHPLPGNNYYRLIIAFSSDLNWYSNRFKLKVDSAQILAAGIIPGNDSLQKLLVKILPVLATVSVDSATGTVTAPVKLPGLIKPVPEIVPSPYVFTNPFTGHINIELPDPKTHQYVIRFYDGGNKMILELPRVGESPLVLDKRNFQKKGLFRFDIFRDRQNWEKGFVSVY